jgi:predicted nucleic acid-binding protein
LKSASSQLQKALGWFSQNDVITPDGSDFISAAKIRAHARRQGSILELPDCLIAAIAVRLGRPLVTGNTADFRAIQATGVQLQIQNWWQP